MIIIFVTVLFLNNILFDPSYYEPRIRIIRKKFINLILLFLFTIYQYNKYERKITKMYLRFIFKNI